MPDPQTYVQVGWKPKKRALCSRITVARVALEVMRGAIVSRQQIAGVDVETASAERFANHAAGLHENDAVEYHSFRLWKPM